MRPANGKILVRVDMSQKDTVKMGDTVVKCAYNYGTNYRERSPVVAVVVEGNAWVQPEDIIICHHNHFYAPSPYHVQDDLFAIPADRTIFGKITDEGSLTPLYGNTFCETINVETWLPVPPEQVTKHLTKALVKDGGRTGYHRGDLIFHRPSAWYEIVFHWNAIQNRVIKVHEDQICGVIRNYRKKSEI